MFWRLIAFMDRFTVGLVIAIVLAVVLPCTGIWAGVFSTASDLAIVLLFFLYGAKLSRQAVIEGMLHWRLQLLVAASTFVMFPLLGMAFQLFTPW